jgi:hypothetical protein
MNHTFNSFLISALLILNIINGSSQEYILLSGRIISKEDSAPIPFATISVNNSTSSISNTEGYFKINIPITFINDSLFISHVSYLPLKISISQFNNSSNITLQSKIISLNEVSVTAISLKDIISNVLKNISKNYPVSSTSNITHLFYEVKMDSSFLTYFDGVLNLMIPDYSNQSSYVKSSLLYKNIFIDKRTDIPYYYGETPFSIIDKIYLRELPFLKNFKQYKYKILETLIDNNEKIYKISFSPIKPNKSFTYAGVMFVNGGNFAIESIDFDLVDNSKNKSTSFYLFDKLVKGTKYISYFKNTHYLISFKLNNQNKYCLNNLNYSSLVNIVNNDKSINKQFSTKCNFFVSSENSDLSNMKNGIPFSLYSMQIKDAKSSPRYNKMFNKFIDFQIEKKVKELKKEYPDENIENEEE